MDAIALKNISKKYTLTQERPILLKSLFKRSKKEEVWALKDVSLTIKKGETVGIIGENGSGKSTLLKIISGITTPTSGEVQVNGRVASLIELGAGFHPDLTGKENVYLNATLLGLTKKEIDQKYQDIVNFADIGEFIDQPVRTYSSGMTVRLGFAVAVHLDPDILLIDEVLAVGDENFQRKSIEKILEVGEKGVTIVFVSHNLSLLESLCKKVFWLHEGKVIIHNDPKKIIARYLYKVSKKSKQKNPSTPFVINHTNTDKKFEIHNVEILNQNNKLQNNFRTLEPIKIRLHYKINQKVLQPMFGIAIFRQDIYIFGSKFLLKTKQKIGMEKVLEFFLSQNGLLRGEYRISIGVCSNNQWERPYDFYDKSFFVNIIENGETLQNDGIVFFKNQWNTHES